MVLNIPHGHAWSQTEATFEGSEAPSGAPVFAAYSNLPGVGWRTSVAVPTDLLTGPAWQSALLTGGGCHLVLLAFGTLLQRKISRGITVPLAKLHRIALAPDSEQFGAWSVPTGMREADELAQALIAENTVRVMKRLPVSNARSSSAPQHWGNATCCFARSTIA